MMNRDFTAGKEFRTRIYNFEDQQNCRRVSFRSRLCVRRVRTVHVAKRKDTCICLDGSDISGIAMTSVLAYLSGA